MLNKIYLGYYKQSSVFWEELGKSVRDYELVFKEKGDYEVVAAVLR